MRLATPAHSMVGYGHFQTGIAFALWMRSRRTAVAFRDVMAEFNCSEATAHRWLNHYESAAGWDRVRASNGGMRSKATEALCP